MDKSYIIPGVLGHVKNFKLILNFLRNHESILRRVVCNKDTDDLNSGIIQFYYIRRYHIYCVKQ